MHLFPEGVIPRLVSCIIFEMVRVKRFIDMDDVNARINAAFHTVQGEKDNTPAPINQPNEPGKMSPKPSASQMSALFRLFPLIFGHLYSEGDEHWELLLQLERLSDIAHAQLLNEEMLHEFRELLPIGTFVRLHYALV